MNNEEKILQILTQLANTVNELTIKVSNIESSQNQIQLDVSDIKAKLSAVYKQTADLTEFHTEVIQTLVQIQNDVEFLTHKETQTEKTLFNLERKVSSTR